MKISSRRDFLKTSAAVGAGLAFSRLPATAASAARVAGANNAVRVAVIGLGDTKAVGGVGGRGHQLIAGLLQVPDVRITTLCDVDETFLAREAQPLKDRGDAVTLQRDLRRVFDDKNVDAVVIATPNHWHALATVWACQAGKDVYVEKPFSHNLWEGEQMVAAARKYGRIVQTGTQNRASPLLREAFAELQRGSLGRMRFAHAIMYRARDGIGRTTEPLAIPAHVDYDLWCGPAAKLPLQRKQLHYEWHWFWNTGNGEMGNNGVHMIDLCRGATKSTGLPLRGMSIGGRFAVDDSAETPNTHIALLEFQPVPLIVEVRNVRRGTDPAGIGNIRGRNRGVIIDCENGYFAGDATGGAYFDRQGKQIRAAKADGTGGKLEVTHLGNFFAAVRSRDGSTLICDAQEGHCSAGAAHFANISYRLGRETPPDAIRERIAGQPQFAESFDRFREHLRQNGVDLAAKPAVLGPWITFDAGQRRFVGEFADGANKLMRREYRAPYVVPQVA